MDHSKLENLAKIGKLKIEPPAADELDGLIRSGRARLGDARNAGISPEGRFDLAYNAAHSLSLAALRKAGYRADNRYIVFQCLQHTVGLPPEQWRVLDEAHRRRNNAEYEGVVEVDEALIESVIRVACEVEQYLEEA